MTTCVSALKFEAIACWSTAPHGGAAIFRMASRRFVRNEYHERGENELFRVLVQRLAATVFTSAQPWQAHHRGTQRDIENVNIERLAGLLAAATTPGQRRSC